MALVQFVDNIVVGTIKDDRKQEMHRSIEVESFLKLTLK